MKKKLPLRINTLAIVSINLPEPFYIFHLSRACNKECPSDGNGYSLRESDWPMERDSFPQLQSGQSNLSMICHQHSISSKISKSIEKKWSMDHYSIEVHISLIRYPSLGIYKAV